MTRYSLLSLIVGCLASGCAPLQPPRSADGAEGVTVSAADPVGPPPALVLYRERRAQTEDDPASYYRPWIAVLPFDDESGFRDGVWDLHNEPARLLSEEMERSTAWRVVSYAAVAAVVGKAPERWRDERLKEIAQILDADMLLTGELLDYNMERLTVGDPLLGGYKSYKGLAEMEVQLTRAAGLGRIGNAHAQQETIDRGLGLDLLGKPREQDYEFANLAQTEYGSEEFRETAIGQATLTAMDQLIQQLSQLVRPQGIQVTSGAAQILSVFGTELFINVGSENGVQKGYRFAVYPSHEHAAGLDPDRRIAVVEVDDIIGARVSKVVALSGGNAIGVGDRLELIGIEPE
ncbi:MAG TPA: hypothetical protein QGF95_01605 [Candidatus Latescibacteria bacterium]|nr:hypothetical protein [Candidatus Latescibacterota bacterium]HJP29230.1 hypothetical protein [Candidatus Latescibacterota bacterium]